MILCGISMSVLANAQFNGEQENILYLREGGIEKYVPRGHHLPSLGMPRDVKR